MEEKPLIIQCDAYKSLYYYVKLLFIPKQNPSMYFLGQSKVSVTKRPQNAADKTRLKCIFSDITVQRQQSIQQHSNIYPQHRFISGFKVAASLPAVIFVSWPVQKSPGKSTPIMFQDKLRSGIQQFCSYSAGQERTGMQSLVRR